MNDDPRPVIDEAALRAYAAERFTTPEAAETYIRWIRTQESGGRRWNTVEDAVGIYVLTAAFGGRRLY